MLQMEAWGSGPRVVFVHGNIISGPSLWSEQRPLAERWRLEIINRRGYGQNPPTDRQDFEVDAQDIADLLGDGAHLVGHSYGGLGALLAAAMRPRAVWSLTVIEPPAFRLARGNAAADALSKQLTQLHETGPRDPAEYAAAFTEAIGNSIKLPRRLPSSLQKTVRILMSGRGPWEAEVPIDELRSTPFPKLVVSGGHHPGLDAICDVLERELRAERAIVRGAGHSIPRTGTQFNQTLEQFLLKRPTPIHSGQKLMP